MLQQRVTLALQATLILLTLSIVHMIGSVFGGLGIISDTFVAIGLVQAIRFAFNSDVRYEVQESFEDFINLEELSDATTNLVADLMAKTITVEDDKVDIVILENILDNSEVTKEDTTQAF